MIIKSINIESFGKLKNVSAVFKGGLNTVYGGNEAGKTTLLSFIVFMFYGVKMKKETGTLSFKDKYLPWDAGVMSGELVYSDGKSDFLISRRFGEGVKRSGEVSVLNKTNGEPLPADYVKDLGKNVFGIGVEGFLRTSFVSGLSASIDNDKDGEIISKLSNFSESGDEDLSYAKMNKILDDKIKDLSSPRKKDALLPTVKSEIESIEDKISIAKAREESVAQSAMHLAEIKIKKEATEKRLAEEKEKKRLAEKYQIQKRYIRIKEDAGVAKAELDRITYECDDKKEDIDFIISDEDERIIFKDTGEELNALEKEKAGIESKIKSAKIFAAVSIILAVAVTATGILTFAPIALSALLFTFAFGYLVFKYKKESSRIHELDRKKSDILDEKAAVLRKYEVKSVNEYIDKKNNAVKSEEAKKLLEFKKASALKIYREKSAVLADAEKEIEEKYGDISEITNAKSVELTYDIDLEISVMERTLRTLENEIIRIESEMEYAKKDTLALVKLEEMKEEKLDILKRAEKELLYFERAKSILDAAYDELKNNFAPKLSDAVKGIFSDITGGKYGQLTVNDSFDMRVKDGVGYKDAKFFSKGTWEQLYFSLRLGIIDIIYNENMSPIFLDDTFESYDNERFLATAEFLKEYSKKHQVILMTCHEREFNNINGSNLLKL